MASTTMKHSLWQKCQLVTLFDLELCGPGAHRAGKLLSGLTSISTAIHLHLHTTPLLAPCSSVQPCTPHHSSLDTVLISTAMHLHLHTTPLLVPCSSVQPCTSTSTPLLSWHRAHQYSHAPPPPHHSSLGTVLISTAMHLHLHTTPLLAPCSSVQPCTSTSIPLLLAPCSSAQPCTSTSTPLLSWHRAHQHSHAPPPPHHSSLGTVLISTAMHLHMHTTPLLALCSSVQPCTSTPHLSWHRAHQHSHAPPPRFHSSSRLCGPFPTTHTGEGVSTPSSSAWPEGAQPQTEQMAGRIRSWAPPSCPTTMSWGQEAETHNQMQV